MSTSPAHVTRALAAWRTDAAAQRGRFEGAPHGSPVSCYIVDAAPGQGPDLHWHPYVETFVVLAGRARFRRGDEQLEAGGGDLVVVPAHTPHRFQALGPERLRLVAIHAAPRMSDNWIIGDA